MPAEDWHSEEKVKTQISKFYDVNAKTPNAEIKQAKQLRKLVTSLEVNLRSIKLCKVLEYTGSSYEGLKITSDGLEFDIMCVMEGEDVKVTEIDGYPAFVNLQLKGNLPNNVLQSFVTDGGVISPQKVLSRYMSEVTKIRDKLAAKERGKITLKYSGPAICLTLKTERDDDWFSVDFVPSIRLQQNGQYNINFL